MDKYDYKGPREFRPLSPWAYFGYSLLFSIPLVGFIVALVLSFNDSNINRRCFARSYFVGLLVFLIFLLVLFVLMLIYAPEISAYLRLMQYYQL